MTEPKLLTEAEMRNVLSYNKDIAINYLRERGLIAAEPVGPLLVEAREVYAVWCEERGLSESAARVRAGEWDDTSTMQIAIAALRRGIEIGAERLTREMVDAAWEDYALNGPRGSGGLHAALVKQMKGEGGW